MTPPSNLGRFYGFWQTDFFTLSNSIQYYLSESFYEILIEVFFVKIWMLEYWKCTCRFIYKAYWIAFYAVYWFFTHFKFSARTFVAGFEYFVLKRWTKLDKTTLLRMSGTDFADFHFSLIFGVYRKVTPTDESHQIFNIFLKIK